VASKVGIRRLGVCISGCQALTWAIFSLRPIPHNQPNSSMPTSNVYLEYDCGTLVDMAIARSLVDEVRNKGDGLELEIGSVNVSFGHEEACYFIRGLLRGYQRATGQL
jgi:hypothetical protein